jgi:hypothetical protein
MEGIILEFKGHPGSLGMRLPIFGLGEAVMLEGCYIRHCWFIFAEAIVRQFLQRTKKPRLITLTADPGLGKSMFIRFLAAILLKLKNGKGVSFLFFLSFFLSFFFFFFFLIGTDLSESMVCNKEKGWGCDHGFTRGKGGHSIPTFGDKKLVKSVGKDDVCIFDGFYSSFFFLSFFFPIFIFFFYYFYFICFCVYFMT